MAVDYNLYGQTITNTAAYATSYAGSGSAEVSFTLANAPHVTITKSVDAPVPLNLGDVVTYTLSLNNSGEASALNLNLSDVLPSEITFAGWVLQNGAELQEGVITWSGDLPGERSFIFTATVNMDPGIYGRSITNTVTFTSDNAGTGSAEAVFSVGMPELSITKSVVTGHDPAQPGDPITYTIVVRNDGTADAANVHIWDVLPDGVIGEGVDITVTIGSGSAYTIIIPAALELDVARGSTVTNTAYFELGDLSGESIATFKVAGMNKIYLPLLRK